MLVLGWVTAEEHLVLLALAGRFASPVIPCVWEAKITGHYWWLLLVTTAGWEVCISCNPVRLGGRRPQNRESVTQIGVCTHLGASLVKQKALPNLPIHWVGRVAARNINCLADF